MLLGINVSRACHVHGPAWHASTNMATQMQSANVRGSRASTGCFVSVNKTAGNSLARSQADSRGDEFLERRFFGRCENPRRLDAKLRESAAERCAVPDVTQHK